ncbi:MAG: aspartate 1-decarboxylase [Myxococcales bacterium]|jgi:aspartate 1-decarboxylase|nr:aspartate 1-decarboxylase [Myxococcales bacterium]
MREMFRSKIHRATVTHADLEYEGSVTIDERLLTAADILEFEAVHVWNVTRGTRFITYAMRGESDSGVICINGAAAHLARPGDRVIIATFCQMSDEDAQKHVPRVVHVDGANHIQSYRTERAGPDHTIAE